MGGSLVQAQFNSAEQPLELAKKFATIRFPATRLIARL